MVYIRNMRKYFLQVGRWEKHKEQEFCRKALKILCTKVGFYAVLDVQVLNITICEENVTPYLQPLPLRGTFLKQLPKL